jgi:hypothetical protein
MSIHDILLSLLFLGFAIYDVSYQTGSGQDKNIWLALYGALTPAPPPLLFSQSLGRFIRSIMKSPEPSVPGHIIRSIIAIEEPVMQLMKKVSQLYHPLTPDQQRFIAAMRDDGCQYRELKMIDHVQGAGGHNDMNQRRRHINHMFERMHGVSGPGARVDISVVY